VPSATVLSATVPSATVPSARLAPRHTIVTSCAVNRLGTLETIR